MFKVPEKRAPVGPSVDPKIQKIVDEATTDAEIDASGLEKHIDWLERAVLLNMDHRLKYAENPEKFMESEIQLDEELGRFEAVACEPNLLPLLTGSFKWHQTFLPLLQHANTDISGRVVALLAEMTEMDESILPEDYDKLHEFCGTLIDNGLMSLLLENLERIDKAETEKATNVDSNDLADTLFKSLSIVENLIDIDAELLTSVNWRPWIDWLSARLYSQNGAEANRFYAAELTAILLRSSAAFKESFLGSPEGIDKVLASILPYKSEDPRSADETEYFENLFGILCDVVLEPKGLELFLECEGVELMILLLKETKMVRIRAIRVLSFALTDRDSVGKVCDRIINQGGLKVLSPILMGKGLSSLKKAYSKLFSPLQDLEYLGSIFSALLRFSSSSERQRVETKLPEKNGEKVGALVSLHSDHYGKGEMHLLPLQQIDLILALLKERSLINESVLLPIKDEISMTLSDWAEGMSDVAPAEQAYILCLVKLL